MNDPAYPSLVCRWKDGCLRLLGWFLVVWVLSPSLLRADRVVLQYQAGRAGNPAVAPTPSGQGWLAGSPTSDTGNFVSAAVSPDGVSGFNAWRMLDNSTASGQFVVWSGSVSSTDHTAASAQGWTLASRLRLADPVAGNAGTRSVVLLYGNGTRRWGLFFDVDSDGVQVASFLGSSVTVKLTGFDLGDHHEHQLIYNPLMSSVSYVVDGVTFLTGYTGEASSFNGVQWGTGSSSGRGDGYWNEVAFVVLDATGGNVSGVRPLVVSSPISAVVSEGASTSLSATFSGGVTGFQWFKGGLPLAGATAATRVIGPLSKGDEGDYWCRAYQGADSFVDSATAAIGVLKSGAGLRINELLASNSSDLRDEDGKQGDWIEIFNADTAPISTDGWNLTEDLTLSRKWPLPAITLAPGEFRIIWATGKDRRVASAPWHTNFSLSSSGGYLALIRPNGSESAVMNYPAQQDDISYGVGYGIAAAGCYYESTSPGMINRDGREKASVSILFNPPAGTFESRLEVGASVQGGPASGVSRYTTDGRRPDYSSPVFAGPVVLSANTSLRVAVIAPGERYGCSATAAYLRRGSDMASFSSPLPLLVLSNFGGGEVPGVSSRGPYGDGSQVVQVAMQAQALTLLGGAPGEPVTLSSPVTGQTRAGLRRRGSSSFSFSRRSYHLETWQEADERSRNMSLLGMPEESDWVLYAPDSSQFDISLLHNSFSYELARQSGFNAPRFRFVELFLDTNGDGGITMDDHKGLYLLVETPTRNRARVAFDALSDDASQGGWMINVDRMDPLPAGSVAGSIQPRQFHTAGPNGLLQTADDIARGVQTSDDMPNFYHSFFNFESPRGWDIRSTQRSAIQTALRNFDAALYGSGYQDPVLGWASHIDARNWAHHLAIQQLSRNQDAVVLSSFLFRETPQSPICWASVFDFDRAYVKQGSATTSLNWAQDRLYYPRLLTDPEFKQIQIDTWQDLRRGAFSTSNMQTLIDAQAAEITTSVVARSGITTATWTRNVSEMKTWLATRGAAIDAQYTAPPVFSQSSGPVTPGLTLAISAPSGVVHYTTDGSDPRLRGGAVSGLAVNLAGPLAINGPLTVTARTLSGGAWSGMTRATFYPTIGGPRFLMGGNAVWNTNSNWESSVYPNSVGQAATIDRPSIASRAITVSAPVTVGSLLFVEADSPFRNRLSAAAPNIFSFASSDSFAARLEVTGSGSGFVEFDSSAGVILKSQLECIVRNTAGDPAYGALRLRQSWTGPGGLTKSGAGTASLTGEGKLYTGQTVVGEGVLQVTAAATPTASASVSVLPGGQLRLNSDGSPIYQFGGPITLRGNGRAAEIPDTVGMGKLGALRYEPAASGSHAVVTNPIFFPEIANIHVAGTTSWLTLTSRISGEGGFRKSGGGLLELIGDQATHTAPILLDTGRLLVRGILGSSVTLATDTVLDAAGTIGSVAGAGQLRIDRARLTSPAVRGVALALVMSGESSDNALLVTDSLEVPTGISLYIDSPVPVTANTRIRGGLVLPASASWSAILNHPALQVFTPDPSGVHLFDGRLWSIHPSARVTRVPSTSAGIPGRILEIRFDGLPLTYAQWLASTFPNPDQQANPSVSGPAASAKGDGVANLVRFALGMDSTGPVRMPKLESSDGLKQFRFPYDPALAGVRWVVEAASDLSDWSGAEILFDSREDLRLPDASGWLGVGDAGGAGRRFYRLRLNLDE